MNREPAWDENLGFLLASFAVASAAASLVPTVGFGGPPGVVEVIIVFVTTFFICMLAIDRPFLTKH